MSDPSTDRMRREDMLHVGNTRPAKLVGLPYPLALTLLVVAYFIQINVGGWNGLKWAAALVGPCWVIAYIAVAHDPYGINVLVAWMRTCPTLLDKRKWGGASCSPLPARPRKMRVTP